MLLCACSGPREVRPRHALSCGSGAATAKRREFPRTAPMLETVKRQLTSGGDRAGGAAPGIAGGAHGRSPPAGGNTGSSHDRPRPTKEVS
jgi:hypothetical protein